jgi:hypothetical protein
LENSAARRTSKSTPSLKFLTNERFALFCLENPKHGQTFVKSILKPFSTSIIFVISLNYNAERVGSCFMYVPKKALGAKPPCPQNALNFALTPTLNSAPTFFTGSLAMGKLENPNWFIAV